MMHRKLAITALIFWVLIVIFFISKILSFSSSNDLALFEALKIVAIYIQTQVLGYGLLSWTLFILLFALRPLVFFPATVMTVSTLYIFGPFVGFVISLIGDLFSATVTFYVGKYFSTEFSITKQSFIKPITPYFQRNAFLSVFILRIVPLFPFDFVNYSAGIFRISFKKYFYATTLGIVPGLLVFVFLAYAVMYNKLLPYALFTTFALILTGIWLKKKYEIIP